MSAAQDCLSYSSMGNNISLKSDVAGLIKTDRLVNKRNDFVVHLRNSHFNQLTGAVPHLPSLCPFLSMSGHGLPYIPTNFSYEKLVKITVPE